MARSKAKGAKAGAVPETVLQRVTSDAEKLEGLGGMAPPGQDFGGEDDPFNDAPDNVLYDVYRLDDRSKKPVYQFRLERTEVDSGLHQVIQDRRGGGTYDVREKYPDPVTGRPKWGRSRRVFVDGPPKLLTVAPPKVEVGTLGPNGQVPQTPPVPGTMDELLQSRIIKMVETQDAVTAGIIERFKRDGDGAGTGMLATLLPIITPLLTAAIERLLTPPAALAPALPPPPMSELLSTLRELKKFEGSLGGGRGDREDSDPMDVVREFAPILRDIFSQAKQEDARRAQPRALPSTTGGTLVTLLSGQIPRLMKLAQEGKSAKVYAPVVADQLPGVYKRAMLDFLSRPIEVWGGEWFERFPQTRPYAKWFVDFGVALRDALGGTPVVADSAIPAERGLDPSEHLDGDVTARDAVDAEPAEGGVL